MSKKSKIFIALGVAALILQNEIFSMIVLLIVISPFTYKLIKEAAEHG